MPTKYVEVKCDLDDLEDHELIEEMESRGYSVFFKGTPLDYAAWCLQNGNISECLFQIEREFPQLKGLSRALDKLTAK